MLILAKHFRHLVNAIVFLVYASTLQADTLLKQGDRMVFLGDSITEQRIHTRYVMNYFALRYPDKKITFRNAGWTGDTATGALNRLDRDVLSLKPNMVSICFGMNDGCCGAFQKESYTRYIDSMTSLIHTLKEAGVQVVLLTAGCVDPDRKSWIPDEKLKIYNPTLTMYAQGIKLLAAREGLPVYDINALMINVQTQAKRDDSDFTMIPDSVHPSPPGQALMAYGLLKTLSCNEQPSGLTIEADKKHISPDRCKVSDIRITRNMLEFTRTDNALPAWFDPEAKTVFKYCPITEELNRYPLKITGLKRGTWRLTVDGIETGEFTSDELAEGINLAESPGPWRNLGEEVNKLSSEQESLYYTRWRKVSLQTPSPATAEEIKIQKHKLEELDKSIKEKEADRIKSVSNRTWHWMLEFVK